MGAVEISIIVIAVLIVVGSLVTYVVRKAKGKPTGSCAGCPYAKNCKSAGACRSDKNNPINNYENGKQNQ